MMHNPVDGLTKKFDEYALKSQFYPTILLGLPLGIFIFFLTHETNSLNGFLYGSTGVSAVLFLATDLVRNLGKGEEKKVFKNESSFPTTEYLLYGSYEFSDTKKKEIRTKIKRDYGVRLPDELQEKKDPHKTRLEIKEVVGKIRQRTRGAVFLHRSNIRYGFWRNMVSSSHIASLSCVLSAVFLMFYGEYNGTLIESVLGIAFYFLWRNRVAIIQHFAGQYAEQFYFEYLNN